MRAGKRGRETPAMGQDREIALVTGASAGIGSELARQLAAHGFDLILVARRGDRLRRLARELESRHDVEAQVHAVDLTETGAAAALHGALSAEGRPVHALVNNAGVLDYGHFADIGADAHRRLLQLNVAALTDMLAHFLPDMRRRGAGRILNVASLAAFMPVPGLASYAASKAYVLSLSEALAEELRGSGITVTALCPGFTDTDMLASASESPLVRLPTTLVSDAAGVAAAGVRGMLRGEAVVVPGVANLGASLLSRSMPKWLLRRVTGAVDRWQR
jgi:short-subunit dehydrogenase